MLEGKDLTPAEDTFKTLGWSSVAYKLDSTSEYYILKSVGNGKVTLCKAVMIDEDEMKPRGVHHYEGAYTCIEALQLIYDELTDTEDRLKLARYITGNADITAEQVALSD